MRSIAPVGPYDYRTQRKSLEMVEMHHFMPTIEQLIRPKYKYFGTSLTYTLMVFPNHVRALNTLVKLSDREKSEQPKGAYFTVDCFFQRAIYFAPDDVVVRMMYARYLGSRKRHDEALAQLKYVEAGSGNTALTLNNLGLIFAELGEDEHALALAHQAAALGFVSPDLKEALVKSGHWQPPPAEAASAPSDGARSSSQPAISPAPAASASSSGS
jgi:hypothetical protein